MPIGKTGSGGLSCVRLLLGALLLLGCGPSPDDARRELDLYGLKWDQAPFLTYAELGGTRIVELYLRGGMDPDVTDPMGRTALMKAAGNGHLETVQTLLTAGADPHLKDAFTNQTAISLARQHGHAEIVRLLEQSTE